MENHARCIFRAFETAGPNFIICDSFQHARLMDAKAEHGMYTLKFDEGNLRSSGTFKKICDTIFLIKR
jgi:hypothetical protein